MYYIPPELALQLAKIRIVEHQAAAEAWRVACQARPAAPNLLERLVRSALSKLALAVDREPPRDSCDEPGGSEQLAA